MEGLEIALGDPASGVKLIPWMELSPRVRLVELDGIWNPYDDPEVYPLFDRWWLIGGEEDTTPSDLGEALAGILAQPVELVAMGDIMLARDVGSAISYESADYPFDEVRELISQADVAFGNLESAGFPGSFGRDKGMRFRADFEAISRLKRAGFDVLSLANNHVADFGTSGMEATLDLLDEMGLSHVGAGRNEEAAYAPLIQQVGGLRVAWLACNAIGTRPAEDGGQPTFAWLDVARLLRNVEAARSQADVVVVSLHWGVEYSQCPIQEQKEIAVELMAAGADLILGHHPHVIQALQPHNDGLVAYSLGNFVFDQNFSLETNQGIALRCLLDERGLVNAQAVPYLISGGRPRFLGGPEGEAILERVRELGDDRDPGEEGEISAMCAVTSPGSAGELAVVRGNPCQGGQLDRWSAKEGWTTGGSTPRRVGVMATGDLDGDGGTDLILGMGSLDGPGEVLALDDSLKPRWTVDAEAAVQALFAADLEGDGRDEVLVGQWGSYQDTVSALDPDGSLRWSALTRGSVNRLAAADLNGDGVKEVLAAADGLYAFNARGGPLWCHRMDGWVQALSVVDWEADGKEEVVVGTGSASSPGVEIVSLSEDGGLVWSHPVSSSVTAIWAGLLDGEARVLAATTEGQLLSLDSSGTVLWSQQGEGFRQELWAGELADLEGVIWAYGDEMGGKLQVLDAEGNSLARCPLPQGPRGMAVADLDGDGALEVVLATCDAVMLADLSYDGRNLSLISGVL
jgi:poly-gamma-glutamate synthesis protein (capsule biosynthesis protein)